jgi:hypothetical protein
MILDWLTAIPNPRVAYVGVEFTCLNQKLEEEKAGMHFNVEIATDADLIALKDKLKGTGYPEGIDLAMRDGSTVYLAKAHDILGFSLINRSLVSVTDGVILRRLKPNEVYSHYSYTLPEFRGKKVFQKLKREIYNREFSRGVEKVISIVDVTNTPSIKAQEHLNPQRRRFVWIVDGKQLRHANQANGVSQEIRSKMVYEGEPHYRVYLFFGMLDKRYHDLRRRLNEMIKPPKAVEKAQPRV